MKKQKTQKTQKIPLSQLAKRIPFRMAVHFNRGDIHSSKLINKRLNIAWEAHVYFKDGKPTQKVETCFYEDVPDSQVFDTLTQLFKANKGIKEKAYKFYGKKQQNKKPKHHLAKKECV